MYTMKIADLSEDRVAKIRALEEETGFHIMALEPGLSLARPTSDQLTKIIALEAELNVTLLAYDG
jgi:hypothetical protein